VVKWPMQTLRTLFLTLLILLPASADAARLAVLEINDLEIEQKVLAQISDGLREGALDTIRGSDADISVMTRESMLMMLDDMGIDPSCIEGECEVETARNIGADYVISATLLKLEGVWILSAKLHESEEGDLLATEKIEANGLLDLSRATPAVAGSLLAKGLGLYASSSAVATSAVSGTEGKIGGGSQLMSSSRSSIVTFESTPPGAVVMLDGRLICPATPCSKQVAEGSHRVSMQVEQYHAAEETVTISKDRTVSLSLKAAFATLNIKTVPDGLPISFGGEQQGKGPLSERVDPGVYEVTVETLCYALTGERVVLNEGDSRSLTITSPARQAGVEISVTDEAGNAVRGTVYADGVDVGSAPGQVVVPLCTKELKVETADGLVWTGTAKLREGKFIDLPVVFPVAVKSVPEKKVREVPAEDVTCDNLIALQMGAISGTFSKGQIACLNSKLSRSTKQTEKVAISKLLMNDVWVKGDKSKWMQLTESHLAKVDKSDPDLVYKYVIQLAKKGTSRAKGVVRWADVALENKTRWSGDTAKKRVNMLYKLKALARLQLYKKAAAKAVSEGTPSATSQEESAKNNYKVAAREWYEFTKQANLDENKALQACVAAAGFEAYCTGS
jgi:hypothetical protein